MNVLRIPQIWKNLAAHPLNGSTLLVALRWSVWQLRSRLSHEVTIPWVNGLKLTGRNGMISISMQAYNGLHELRDSCFACHLLNEDDLFFDIGANIGVYSMILGHISGARGIAFEPVPKSAEYLTRNLTMNGLLDRVLVVQAAVSAQTGVVSMSTDADVMNKIVADGVGITVPSVTVDSASAEYGTPQLMKIDVEGFEPAVIAGAGAVLQDSRLLALILEINDNARKDGTDTILNILTNSGFVETGYDPKGRSLIMPFHDGAADNRLFIRASVKDQIEGRLKVGKPIRVRNKIF
ncbi:MAG: hypothetical protein CFE34_00095 [Rhodobacteraceae bacterium PARR1]|nr:MAG: hypothetical protein CFE34_00095 [Rhodobacteraceae bacterium PARR1]